MLLSEDNDDLYPRRASRLFSLAKCVKEELYGNINSPNDWPLRVAVHLEREDDDDYENRRHDETQAVSYTHLTLPTNREV